MRIESVPVILHRGVQAAGDGYQTLATFRLPAGASWAAQCKVFLDLGSDTLGIVRIPGVTSEYIAGPQHSLPLSLNPASHLGKTLEILALTQGDHDPGVGDDHSGAIWLRSAHCILTDTTIPGSTSLDPGWVGSIPEEVVGEAGQITESRWAATRVVQAWNYLIPHEGASPPPLTPVWFRTSTGDAVIPAPLDPAWDGMWLRVQLRARGTGTSVSRDIPITVL